MATIEERLAKLEKTVNIKDDGTVVILGNKIRVSAATIELEGAATIHLKGGFIELNAGMNLMLKGAALAHVQAGIVKLNGGSRPVAFVGSQVVPGVLPFMKVDTGNRTVLA